MSVQVRTDFSTPPTALILTGKHQTFHYRGFVCSPTNKSGNWGGGLQGSGDDLQMFMETPTKNYLLNLMRSFLCWLLFLGRW
jgi:hypothetical protein